MRPAVAGWRVLAVALCGALGSAHAASRDAATAAPARTPHAARADEPAAKTRAHLEALLGEGKRVRDFASFTTERGEPALLVLYVTGAREEQAHCFDKSDPLYSPSRGCDLYGDTFLHGTYSVALVIGGTLINTIRLGEEVLPLTAPHGSNHLLWGQGTDYPEGDPRNAKIEPTKIIKLADYNGDGHAWEFRHLQYEASGHFDTMLLGYSARQRKLIIYPAIIRDSRGEAPDNLFPSPNDAATARKLHYHFACGEHGSDLGYDRDFEYDASKEAWVMTGEKVSRCDEPNATPIVPVAEPTRTPRPQPRELR